ncbi:MAG: PHP domain-containing protein [Lachnospiraceae bacterium]|nr:PHP domain-containing protein [Lachnospiraceae bacterium]
MKYIDLHVHSTVSDGTFTPTELVHLAKKNNVAAFALTDHDTASGVFEAQQAAKGTGVEVISGVEVSAGYKDSDIHILGLMIDPEYEPFKARLEKARQERDDRNAKMAENLANAGLDIDIDRLTAAFPAGTVLTRAHFGRFLMDTHQVSSINDAFDKYLNSKSPYYVSRKYISPEDTITLIKNAGGIPVLAHPLIYRLPEQELDALISRLKDAGLEGLEVFYSNNTGFDEGIARRYANKYNLVMTGGSDFHGTNKPQIALGKGRGNLQIPYSVLDNLRKLV